jgi:hypothetical protein
MDITNFQQFIKDSDNYPDVEYHGWRLMTTTEEEAQQQTVAMKAMI